MKEKPPKRERTRKQKALRRTAILLMMVIFVSVVGAYGFVPAQGRHYNEERSLTGRTHLVQRFYDPSLKATKMALFDLTENKNVTMLHCVRWHPMFGWSDASAAVIDCGGDAPLYGGFYALSHHMEEGQLFFVFGRVDDPNITSLKISLKYHAHMEAENEETWTEVESRTSSCKDWKGKEGHRYFVENLGLIKWDYQSSMKIILTAYDQNAQELTSIDVSHYGSGISFG